MTLHCSGGNLPPPFIHLNRDGGGGLPPLYYPSAAIMAKPKMATSVDTDSAEDT